MQGVITGRHLVRHAFTILQLWGPGFYARCLLAIARGERTTFLEVLCAANVNGAVRVGRERRRRFSWTRWRRGRVAT